MPLPLHFLLHQSPNIPPIPHYQQTLPTSPNYPITITTILQSISQPLHNYNKHKANPIIPNHPLILSLPNLN
ncbi:type IV secretory system conjugative DNA transfer family protein, partial [Staphylococcus capitis]|uniref:type IV secretory system conjugative DNA transfer family protein n=1 Tax=Staphylococcus capitis TaxID=29388 RepID=UPI0037096B84